MRKSLVYRPEIDGLRALAVAFVVLYHAKFTFFGQDWFQGGFVGVDVFMVISGYLISKIIILELKSTDSFNIVRFYLRRVRRIAPMLLTVMVTSLPFAVILMIPAQFAEYMRSVGAALLFGSNIFFYFSATEYGAQSSLLMPFLHTWSLSVEEQYYLIFPLAFLLAHRWLKNFFLPLIALGLLLSLLLAEITSSQIDQALSFYMLPTRMWEFLFGALLTLIELKHRRGDFHALARFVPIIGLCLILFSGVFFDDQTVHPGLMTLLPVVGTGLIIFFSSGQEFVGALLSTKSFVATGLISYSLYLWHFPVFAFARLVDHEIQVYQKITCIVLSILLSVFSYFVIERPFRDARIIGWKPFNIAVTVMWIIVAGSVAFSVTTQDVEKRDLDIFPTYQESELVQDGRSCFARELNDLCEFVASPNAQNVYLIGDSHLDALSKSLRDELASKYNFYPITKNSCVYLPGFRQVTKQTGKVRFCDEAYFSTVRDRLKASDKHDIIILGGRLPVYISSQTFDNEEGGIEEPWGEQFVSQNSEMSVEEGIVKAVDELLDWGKIVVFVYPIPEVGWHVPARINALRPNDPSQVDAFLDAYPVTTSYDVYLDRTRQTFKLLDSIDNPNFYRVYPHELLCNNQVKGRCITNEARHTLYYDDDHPSYFASKWINSLIMGKIRSLGAKDSLDAN